jgi:hypothetical protein
MDPHIYPDPQLAPITLPAAPATGAPAPTFTPIEQLAAPDPSTPFIAKTMFIRVAMSGAPCGSVIAPTAPNFYLKADTGDAVLINDHTKLPDQTYSIYHRPGTDPRDFVADGKVDLESNNVFRITVVFQDPAGTYTWQFGIWNNDTGASRQFTWVLSATLANTAQPWIDVEPTILSWDVLVNNKGTAPFTVNSVSPALPAGFALGPLPVSLNPGTSAPLTVTFTGSGKPSGTKGSVTATANVTITPADGTAETSAGHNRQLSVSATDDTPPADQIKALSEQLAELQAVQKRLAGDLDHRFEQLNSRIDAQGKIIDMKVAFGVAGGGGALVFTGRTEYVDSPTKTTHTDIVSGDVIFMIAMVHGYNTDGGPGFARGRIIRTTSPGFDVFGTEDAVTHASVVTFAEIPRALVQGDGFGGGTLMIAATANASGSYDCRVQIKQEHPGFGAMQLQHMMSFVFRHPLGSV